MDKRFNDEDDTKKENNNNGELNEMFDSKDEVKRDDDTLDKSSGKVLVKTNDTSISTNENGYGSVLGFVLVIISVSFILSALFIRMMS